MPVDLGPSGRFYGGKSARARAPWPCPNCGVTNTGPLVGGCSNCGSGKPPEGGLPQHAGVGPGAGLTRSEVASLIVEILQRQGVMAPPLEAEEAEPEGPSVLEEEPSSATRAMPPSEVVQPATVTPLTLPEIDTSDPRVRLTIAVALRDWANTTAADEELADLNNTTVDGAEAYLTSTEALTLATKIAPELVGEQVDIPVDDAAEAQQAEVGEQHKREILSRLRAPNSK